METPHSADSISLGTVEVGVMFALLTHGVLTLQAYDYFRRCTDPITMRLVISLIWAASSVHVACASWLLYSATITNHGVPIDSIKYPLALPAGSALGAVIHCSVQGVYIYRMFRFGHGWSVALLCSVLTAYEFGVGMAFSVIEARYNWEAALGRFEDAWAFLVYSFFGAAAVVDVAIAVSVTYYLRRGRNQVERTSFLIDRLVVWTIQTGAITSITAITVIILFAVHRENNAWLGVYTFLTNLYPLALIALLNGREHLKPPKDGAPRTRSTTTLMTLDISGGSVSRQGSNRCMALLAQMDKYKTGVGTGAESGSGSINGSATMAGSVGESVNYSRGSEGNV